MAKEKVQISMDSELLNEVDDYCDRNYINRSLMISQACLQIINQQKLVDSIASLSQSIELCAKAGQLDDDTRREMERFETLSRMLVK